MRKLDLRAILTSIVLASVGIALISATPASGPVRVGDGRPTILAPREMKYFTLGYSEVVADTLWLRVIQDFEYCEKRKVYRATSYSATEAVCERGWVYHMVDAITELAPKFRHPYLYGGLFLSVLVNDIEGAAALLGKAVERFPQDWQLIYLAGYHAALEEKDELKASRLLAQAGRAGAPPWIFSLAAKLSEKEGKVELSKSILEEALKMNLDPATEERIKTRLHEVDAELKKQAPSRTQ